jgi:hypothetical protein
MAGHSKFLCHIPTVLCDQPSFEKIYKVSDARFEVFTVVKIQVEVFCVVTLCSVAVIPTFRKALVPQVADRSSKVPRNVDILPQRYTASQPGRPLLQSS